MAKYDEDLHENRFFLTLVNKNTELFNEAAENCWMVCVPRAVAATKMKIQLTDIRNHILKPIECMTAESDYVNDKTQLDDNETSVTRFVTVNGKYLTICGEMILTGEGFKHPKQVRILFDECFFNSRDQSYQVLCIEQPLEGVDEQMITIVALENFDHCNQFLWSDTGGEKMKKAVDGMCALLKIEKTSNLDRITEAARTIYERALQETTKIPLLRKVQEQSHKHFLQLATETYVLHKLHSVLIRELCKIEKENDHLNKITRRMHDVKPFDLGMSEDFVRSIPEAREQLQHLNQCKSPLEKVACFKKTVGVFANQTLDSSSEALTADVLLPLLVYLVLTTEIPNWKSNLDFIYNFHFSQVGTEEFLYYLTSFEAAVEYVTKGTLEKNLGKDYWKKRLPAQGAGKLVSPDLLHYFEVVCDGNITAMEKLLEDVGKLPEEVTAMLCHPLCSCALCKPIIASYYDNPGRVSVYSRDRLRRTGLHYASLMGHQEIVQKLMELKAEIDGLDTSNMTPLHLACLGGHQKCLLYLLSEGASVNKIDKRGNTPLHLVCSHGFVDCVLPLLFHKEQNSVSSTNDNGDTPLHCAARWGYSNIVAQLLENTHSVPSIKNKYGEIPLQCSWNPNVMAVFQQYSPNASIVPSGTVMDVPSGTKERAAVTSLADVSFQRHSQPEGTGTGSRVKRRSKMLAEITNETDRQLKKLFRAIKDGDISYVKYLLNLTEPGTDAKMKKLPEFCHPLCQCEKCIGMKKVLPLALVTVNTCDDKGFTPLHKAALHGQTKIVQLLLETGAPMNARTRDDQLTPLHFACQYNHKDVVMILLEKGAEVNACNVKGDTPLHFCCNNGHMDSATLLMIHGADLTAVDNRGNTPLHNAAKWNRPTLVKELILYGALYSATNNDQKAPVDLTRDDEVRDVIRRAMKGEIEVGLYQPVKTLNDPSISDED